MRRLRIALICIVLSFAVILLVGAIKVDGALTSLHQHASTVCFTQRDREKLAAGWFTPDRQDIVVAKAVNFELGEARMAWWHLRGAWTYFTYRWIWSAEARAAEFQALYVMRGTCASDHP